MKVCEGKMREFGGKNEGWGGGVRGGTLGGNDLRRGM